MTAAKAPRGRPKGSGINDQQQLNEIARLMRSTPRMKPTTAIKALGITDPSTIRRLRDKFNAAPQDRPNTSGACAPTASGSATAPRAAALKFSEPVKRIEPLQARPAAEPAVGIAASTRPSATPRPAEPVPMAALLFGFGLNAASAIFEQQMMLAETVMRMPQVRDFVRHQIAITEFMLNAARPSPGSRLAH